MLFNNLRLTLRTFLKNKAAFIINLFGMGIALGCSITAWVNYEYSVDFDKQQKNSKQLYRIGFWEESEKRRTPYGVSPMPVGNLIRENLNSNDQVIQYIRKGAQFRIGDEMFSKDFIYADPVFTELFTIDLLSGSLQLKDKSQVMISDELALTYFGKTDVLGSPLTQIISGEPREYTISGVFKRFPANSSFRFDLLTTFDNYFVDEAQKAILENDWSRWATTFLYLESDASVASLTRQLQSYIKLQNEARPDLKAQEFYIESFVGMADRAVKQRNQGHWLNMPMPPAAVIAPFAMAAFILLVACFNFMNNAIAMAGNRLKEIGIRKVIGGRRKELIFQFLSETFVFCLLAMGLALIFAEFFVDGWNGMWSGIEIVIRYSDNVGLFVALGTLTLVTALLAGGYPAFYISSFKPIEILRGTTRFGGANLLTKSLLVVQFSISLAAVIFALAFYTNSRYQREYDLGYSWRSVIQVPLDDPKQYDLLKNALASNPLIHSVGGSQHHIYTSSYKAAARSEKHQEHEVDMLNIGDDYFGTVNVRLIAGRAFEKDRASDIDEAIIVNEEFARVFGFGKEAIGQRIMLNDSIPVYITGIVKDVYLKALFQPLTPLAFRYVPKENYRYLLASTDPEQLAVVNKQIKDEYKKLFPTTVYTGRLMEQDMVMALEHFDAVVILYTFLGIVAIVMSVSGLYAMVSLNLQRRTKELGIRKIMGAPLLHMIGQCSKLFLIIMAISCILGSLLGSVMVNGLMGSIWEYYEAINARVLSMAIVILLVIAIATIAQRIRLVVVHNPVDLLRHE